MKKMLATLILEDQRKIVFELYPEIAPQAVMNFVGLANNGFFDKMSFCRVVNGRLIQIGDTNLEGEHWIDVSPGYIIDGEFNKEGYVNPLSFEEGVVGMAMADYEWTPNASAGSFFIMCKSEAKLDSIVPAFARVVEGIEIVREINQIPTKERFGFDVPEEFIHIDRIELNELSKTWVDKEPEQFEDKFYEKVYGKKTQRILRFD